MSGKMRLDVQRLFLPQRFPESNWRNGQENGERAGISPARPVFFYTFLSPLFPLSHGASKRKLKLVTNKAKCFINYL